MASQPLVPRKAIMRPLRPGEGWRRDRWVRRHSRLALHLQVLAVQLQACPPRLPPAPITPLKRSRPDGEGMQQHTHLTRLVGGAALPLTLFPQGAGATTADAGRIDHTQASIDLSSPSVPAQGLPSRATQGAICLGNKVTPREASSASCAGPLQLVHTLVQVRGPADLLRRGVLGQTRWCAPAQGAVDGPVPGACSTPIG